MHSDLRSLDLNLLVALDALLRRRSVIAAADELAMSPSALSHALARLRAALDDELFVRIGNAMQPTAHAERLAGPVSAALALLSNGLAQAGRFDPATSDRCFTLAATDYTTFAMLPALVAQCRIWRRACASRSSTRKARTTPRTWPRAGWISRWVMWKTWPSPLRHRELRLADRSLRGDRQPRSSRIRSAPSLDAYMAERHVAVRPWGEAGGHIDKLLERRGLRRDVAVQLPSVLAAPFIVAGSVLIMTVPRQARTLGAVASIVEYPPPFEIPPFTLKAYSHVRQRSGACLAARTAAARDSGLRPAPRGATLRCWFSSTPAWLPAPPAARRESLRGWRSHGCRA